MWQYNYVLGDHIGNTRVTFADTTGNGLIDPTIEIAQINHFYPYGLNMEGNWNGASPNVKNKYQYGDKELQTDFGLNWNDYGARFYDPAIGRWLSPDPLAEKYYRWSPYNYCVDNPINHTDPTGMDAMPGKDKNEAEEYNNQAAKGAEIRQFVNNAMKSNTNSHWDNVNGGSQDADDNKTADTNDDQGTPFQGKTFVTISEDAEKGDVDETVLENVMKSLSTCGDDCRKSAGAAFGFAQMRKIEITQHGERLRESEKKYAEKKWADAARLVYAQADKLIIETFQSAYTAGIYTKDRNGNESFSFPVLSKKSLSNAVNLRNKVKNSFDKMGITPSVWLMTLGAKSIIGYKPPRA